MTNDCNLALYNLILRQITASQHQRITFAEYMDLVLYHPQQGYYATNAVNIGSQGDFFTSSHLNADFGELLAEQFAQMWDILGHPVPFTLVEMGAGVGLLAGDILKYLHLRHPDFFNALEYIIVEKARGLISQQQKLLTGLPIRWSTLEEIPSNSIVGCCFSNELVDAFPVHQFTLEGGQFREIYITTHDGKFATSQSLQLSQSPDSRLQTPDSRLFVEVTGEPSTPRLLEYFDLVEINFSHAFGDGYRSEVNLAAIDWLSAIANKLQCGYLLTIDYGYPSIRYYNPIRSQGTLQCYYCHSHHSDPYINIGYQDITAHVDFTALERQGELCGLQKVGFTKQGMFLMALGLGDRIAAISACSNQDIQQLLQRRDALHQLIDPQGLGSFGVLVQSKGLKKASPLKGLTIPSH